MSTNIRRLIIGVATLFVSMPVLHPQAANADVENDPSTYRFGGSCALQGNWTQAALATSNSLKGYIKAIRDDANCKVLRDELVTTFDGIAKTVEANRASTPATDNRANLLNELGALRSYLTGSQNSPTGISALLKIQENLMESSFSDASVNMSEVTRKDGVTEPLSQHLKSLQARARQTFNQSLTYVDSALDRLPQVKECLVDPNTFPQYIAATVQLMGSFVSSGQDPSGAGLARTITKFADYSRQMKFGNALNTLSTNEFVSALQCLLEVASESYCSTRDAMLLFEEMTTKNTQLGFKTNNKGEQELTLNRTSAAKFDPKNPQHPLSGYYILSQNMKTITDWLQSIQLGSNPMLPTDAQQRINVLSDNNNFLMSRFQIYGDFGLRLGNLQTYPTLAQKQNELIEIIEDIYNTMQQARGQNFFMTAFQPMHLPFKLLGIETPPVVMGTSGSGIQQDPIRFIQANYATMDEFKDPEMRAKIVNRNLEAIMRAAESSSIDYYSKWFLVDKVSIVNRAIVGMLYSPRESMVEVEAYLNGLEQKIMQTTTDRTMIPGIRDTRMRIQLVLNRFTKLDELGGEFALSRSNGELSSQNEMLVEELIKEVYNQFMVQLAKSGWLANRMSTFVEYDLSLSQRAGYNIGPYLNDIYVATGNALAGLMVDMAGSNPTLLRQDLNTALVFNKGNVEAIEQAFSGAYVNQMLRLKYIADGRKNVSGLSIYASKQANRVEPWVHIPGRNYVGATINFLFNPLNNNIPNQIMGYLEKGDSLIGGLGMPFGGSKRLSPDSEFGSAQSVLDQMCIQTLAFPTLEPFWKLCSPTVFPSPFANALGYAELPDALKRQLSLSYTDKAWEFLKPAPGEPATLSKNEKQLRAAKNHSARICALRDFSRRNYVLYLLQGQSRQK